MKQAVHAISEAITMGWCWQVPRVQTVCISSVITEPSVTCRKFGLSYLGKAQQLQEQCCPFLLVSAVFSCVQTMVCGCQGLGFLMCAQILIPAITHMGCTDTVRESALKVDSGRKIPCCTGDWNPCQYCTLFFQLDAVPVWAIACPVIEPFWGKKWKKRR